MKSYEIIFYYYITNKDSWHADVVSNVESFSEQQAKWFCNAMAERYHPEAYDRITAMYSEQHLGRSRPEDECTPSLEEAEQFMRSVGKSSEEYKNRSEFC